MEKLKLLPNTDIIIFGYYDDYNILHINHATAKSGFLTIDNILEFLKVKDIKCIYEPIMINDENTSI